MLLLPGSWRGGVRDKRRGLLTTQTLTTSHYSTDTCQPMSKTHLAQGETSTVPTEVEEERRFFYGWVVVACTFTVLCIAYGIQFTFGVFMPAIW
jgi:hypothetical protein